MVDRNVEEPLNLRLVQIHRQHAVRARRAEHVGDQLGRNRHARLVLPILPRVTVIRQHRRDARRRRAAERVDHDHQLHEVLVDRRSRRRTGRLDDEHVGAADVLVDLERRPPCRETACSRAWPSCTPRNGRDLAWSARDARCPKTPSVRRTRLPSTAHLSPDNPRDLPLRTLRVRRDSLTRPAEPKLTFAGPVSEGWLGRKDSNLRIRDPKSRALPLGHAPTLCTPGAPAPGQRLLLRGAPFAPLRTRRGLRMRRNHLERKKRTSGVANQPSCKR